MSKQVAEVAKSFVGKHFKQGQREQCMFFVRHVLKLAGHPYADRVTNEPVDKHWTGPGLASSLAGRDLGHMLVKIDQIQPGDIVFWNDTYETGFPPNTITHVGIAENNKSFIHRPTAARPVERANFTGIWQRQFRCALRLPPMQSNVTPSPKKDEYPLNIIINANGFVLRVNEDLPKGDYQIYNNGSSWSGKAVPRTK